MLSQVTTVTDMSDSSRVYRFGM